MEARYTVVVARPQKFISQFNSATYTACVMAITTEEAIKKAEKEAMQSAPPETRGRLLDWQTLVVFYGWHDMQYQL